MPAAALAVAKNDKKEYFLLPRLGRVLGVNLGRIARRPAIADNTMIEDASSVAGCECR